MKKSEISTFISRFILFLSFLFIFSVCTAAVDTRQYISIDEVKTDMEAYCLTVFSGLQVERFELKILSVVRGVEPGHDMILVVGTDDRFQHAGTVHGCSGSPVYIDGRLAGALAAGWDGGLDSLYLVRPIQRMMETGSVETAQTQSPQAVFQYDFSKPLDLADICEQSMQQLEKRRSNGQMLLPLVSSLSPQVCQSLAEPLRHVGLVPVSGVGLAPTAEEAGQFEPGGVLAIPLCSGDISLAATGTVTEIVDDQIYGFGHSFTGRGPVHFPIAAGVVHTVIAGRSESFKLSTPGPILGTLEYDQATSVRGTIGRVPETIPLTIQVKRFNDPSERTYDCQLAKDRLYTPTVARVACNGAAISQGDLPEEHTVSYQGQVKVKDYGVISFENISSDLNTAELEQTVMSTTSLLLNNPFEAMDIESIDVKMEIEPGSQAADIWAADVSESQVEPGQEIVVTVILKSFRAEETKTKISLTVPDNLPAGKYKLQIMSDASYKSFMSQAAPQRFRVFDGESLIAGLRRVNSFRNNRLHAVMAVPSTGIVIREHELPKLPQSKMLLMQDSKRLRPIAAYKDWIESSTTLDKIVQGTAEIEIIVE